jgi:hypothetical protein
MNIAISCSFVAQYKRTIDLWHRPGVHIAKRRDAHAITKTGVRRQPLLKVFSPGIPASYDATVRRCPQASNQSGGLDA